MSQPAVEVLIIARGTASVSALCAALTQQGSIIDLAESLTSARAAFENRGGHSALVFGPDVGKALIDEILTSLRELDPQLPAVAFGVRRDTLPSRFNIHCVPDFHPSSRAGVGAVLKVLFAGNQSSR